jgi:hypothetical protein
MTLWGLPPRKWVIGGFIGMILTAGAISAYAAYRENRETHADKMTVDVISHALGYTGDNAEAVDKYLRNWMRRLETNYNLSHQTARKLVGIIGTMKGLTWEVREANARTLIITAKAGNLDLDGQLNEIFQAQTIAAAQRMLCNRGLDLGDMAAICR